MAVTYYRDDATSITVTLEGVVFPDWDSWSGGNLEADTVKYRTLQAGEIDLGGPASRGDLTITKQSNDIVVSQYWPAFEAAVGGGKCKAALKFTGPGGVVQATHTRDGIIKAVNPGDMDRSSNSPGRHTFSIVISMNEKAAN